MNKTRTRILEDMIIKKEKIQSTSSSLKVENTAEGFGAKIVGIESNRLFQEKRQGYNKLGKATLTTTDGGIDLKLNEDNSFVLSGTTTKSCYIDFEIENISVENLTVVFNKGNVINSFGADVRLVLYNNNTSLNDTSLINKTYYSITSTQEINRARIWIQAGNTFNNDEFYPMILEGTYTLDTIPEYEKYGKMPSLEHKSEIEGISGDVVVKTQSKNLINNNFKFWRMGQEHHARVENDLIDNKFIDYNKKIIISTNLDMKKFKWAINIINYPNYAAQGINKNGYDPGWQNVSLFRISDEAREFLKNNIFENMVIVVAKINDSTISEEELAEIRNSKFQLEYGEEATEYVEHKEQVTKISLGDKVLYGNEKAKDKIVRKNGKWYFALKFKELNSTLNVNDINIVEQGFYILDSTLKNIKSAAETFSTHQTKNEKYDSEWKKYSGCLFGQLYPEAHLGIYFNYKATSKSDAIKWYNSLNNKLLYKLKETEYEEITDEKLINQLNKLLFLKEYDDTTNFEFDKDVIFEIEVQKDKKEERIAMLEKEITEIKQLVLENGGTVNE